MSEERELLAIFEIAIKPIYVTYADDDIMKKEGLEKITQLFNHYSKKELLDLMLNKSEVKFIDIDAGKSLYLPT